MYTPKQFALTDTTVIERFIRENGFATLVTSNSSYPVATHLPLELETNSAGVRVLSGHMAKANPQWKSFETHPQVTAIFLSDIHQYISSSWYDHPNAPTWNYITVHVMGTAELLDERGTWNAVKNLVDRYEKNSEHPVSLETLPASVQRDLAAVAAFQIRIEKIEATCKMSQNRDDKNYALILKQLRKSGDAKSILVADMMEQLRPMPEGKVTGKNG